MLFIICEGFTEALFVSRILRPVFLDPQGKLVTPINMEGQLKPYPKVEKLIKNLLKNPEARVTTLIDYYGTPKCFPGMPHRPLPVGNPAAVNNEVARLEADFASAIDNPRFIPNYLLHEFETLAFADPAAIVQQRKRLPGPSIEPEIRHALARAQNRPELVNDSEETSPSHRLIGLWPKEQYQKTIDSIEIVQRIPFARLQAECPRFAAWTARL